MLVRVLRIKVKVECLNTVAVPAPRDGALLKLSGVGPALDGHERNGRHKPEDRLTDRAENIKDRISGGTPLDPVVRGLAGMRGPREGGGRLHSDRTLRRRRQRPLEAEYVVDRVAVSRDRATVDFHRESRRAERFAVRQRAIG